VVAAKGLTDTSDEDANIVDLGGFSGRPQCTEPDVLLTFFRLENIIGHLVVGHYYGEVRKCLAPVPDDTGDLSSFIGGIRHQQNALGLETFTEPLLVRLGRIVEAVAEELEVFPRLSRYLLFQELLDDMIKGVDGAGVENGLNWIILIFGLTGRSRHVVLLVVKSA
jgi:hypothetical protein